MSRRHCCLTVLSVVGIGFLSVGLFATSVDEKMQIERFGESTLAGLKGVCIRVNLLKREGVSLPVVNESTLQKDIELELRRVGLSVLADANDFDAGTFVATITVDKVKGLPMYLIGGTYGVYQYTALLRQPHVVTYNPTWPVIHAPISYCAGIDVAEDLINDVVADKARSFANDYLAANPPKAKGRTSDEKGTTVSSSTEGAASIIDRLRASGALDESPEYRLRHLQLLGIHNTAYGKPVSSTDDEPIIGTLAMITDGDKKAADASYVEIGPFPQSVTIDLKTRHKVYAVVVWHYLRKPAIYYDVICQVSTDEAFQQDVTTLYNNDTDNSIGQGVGIDPLYMETSGGKLIPANGTIARYVRLYSNGNTNNDLNHYVEVEVYATPVEAESKVN